MKSSNVINIIINTPTRTAEGVCIYVFVFCGDNSHQWEALHGTRCSKHGPRRLPIRPHNSSV